MRKLFSCILLLLTFYSLHAADPYDALSARAARGYAHSEWASASAMYMMLSEKDPSAAMPYSRIMVCESMRGDSAAVVSALERSVSAGVPLDSVVIGLRNEAVALGRPDIYEKALVESASALPWLKRRLDIKLLDFYTERRNAPAMMEYARKILAGVPDNVPTLILLGRAYAMEGRFDEAVEAWTRAEKVAPDNFDVLLELGNYYAIADPQKALPYIKKACAIRSTPYLENLLKRLSPVE